ncbi:hypothetical protein B484DRAFT_408013 [Ochromonadaceae sp. CCMP2298]|nr:hypothetical protein B484DRAFT_408013 [Ochromonadaceae sp. CCMP2298]
MLKLSAELVELKEVTPSATNEDGSVNALVLQKAFGDGYVLYSTFWKTFGVGDPGLQAEYAFQRTPSPEFEYQATIVKSLLSLGEDQKPSEIPEELTCLEDLANNALNKNLLPVQIRDLRRDLEDKAKEDNREDGQSVKKQNSTKKRGAKSDAAAEQEREAEIRARRDAAKANQNTSSSGGGGDDMEGGLVKFLSAQSAIAVQATDKEDKRIAKVNREEALQEVWDSLHDAGSMVDGEEGLATVKKLLDQAGIKKACKLPLMSLARKCDIYDTLKEVPAADFELALGGE